MDKSAVMNQESGTGLTVVLRTDGKRWVGSHIRCADNCPDDNPAFKRQPLHISPRGSVGSRRMSNLGDIPLPVNPSAEATIWSPSTSTAASDSFGNGATNPATNLSSMQEYPWMASAFGMMHPQPPSRFHESPDKAAFGRMQPQPPSRFHESPDKAAFGMTQPQPPSRFHESPDKAASFYNPYSTMPWQRQTPPGYNGAWNQQNQNNYQQQWNRNGSNYGNNFQQQWGPQQSSVSQSTNSFKPFKLGMKPLSSNFIPSQAAGPIQNENGGGFGGAPENVKRYIQRARMAIEQRDEGKLTEYLKKRLHPLINSGAVRMINWDIEPLPHEVNFEIKSTWTPVSQLQGFMPEKSHGRSKRPYAYGSAEKSSENVPHPKKKSQKKPVARGESQSHSADIYKASPQNQKVKKVQKWNLSVSDAKKNERALRFAEKSKKTTAPAAIDTGSELRNFLVRGTCQTVEKAFFRLTAAPDPSQVRPLEVLQKALELVKKKYRGGAEYSYLSSQLRSIRQDLTVQRIRNLFTVTVYETHARICLENKDREEFNQCQNQLKALYKTVDNAPHKDEFTAYRLLYFVYMQNSTDILTLLKETKTAHNGDKCMMYALKVREAWARQYYPRLFKLYCEAPKMCGYIMDMFVERERKIFMNHILKAHRTSISVDVLSKWMGLAEKELIEWLTSFDISLQDGSLDCKTYANKKLE
ncbi:unnamed protein product, partial [Mesorhabditis belari]|uniref:SAC3/GANP/THP3 conserved domain-containing protein n=1 Tax=Mesorhabditis belari TaxID=2138241 RepID=A0AAF3EAD7_9BILA